MPGGMVEIDTVGLAHLARDLRSGQRSLRLELLRRIRQAADPVKRAVQEEASWSTRIPGAVSVRASYAAKGAKVRVVVDARKAPEARPINNNDRPGTFRHPVFADTSKTRADWTWVSQQADPFMARAAARTREETARRVAEVYEDVAHKAGFH